MTETAEKNQSLWLLTASPTIWAAHFLLCYVTAAIWCAKVVGPGGSLASVRVAIAVYTVLALAGIGIIGWVGYRRHSYGNADPAARRRHAGGSASLPGLRHAAAVGVERGGRHLRGPGRRLLQELSLMRRVLLIWDCFTLAAVWLGPLPQLGAARLLRAHDDAHGRGGGGRAAPRPGSRGRAVRSGAQSSRGCSPPIPASVLELVVVWAWHAPALHHAARHSTSRVR